MHGNINYKKASKCVFLFLLDAAKAVEQQIQRIYVTPKNTLHGSGNPWFSNRKWYNFPIKRSVCMLAVQLHFLSILE